MNVEKEMPDYHHMYCPICGVPIVVKVADDGTSTSRPSIQSDRERVESLSQVKHYRDLFDATTLELGQCREKVASLDQLLKHVNDKVIPLLEKGTGEVVLTKEGEEKTIGRDDKAG